MARVTLEVRLRAVLEVTDGARVIDVADRYGVSRQTVTAWRKRYEASGVDGLSDRSRRPHSSPTRIDPAVEALICEMRRQHRRWGARRLTYELSRQLGSTAPSRSTIHRVLVRNGLVNPQQQQHKRKYRRWAREAPMHLWQLDLVGGIFLSDGRECKMLTGIDDHSRFVVVAAVLPTPSGHAVSDAFITAMDRWGVPFEVLTDNGKQFTGKHTRPLPVEVLFERTCREYGITPRLTKRRSPTTTGKIERFHRTLRRELLDETGTFDTIETAQQAIDEWVHAYNHFRPHQALDMSAPADLFRTRTTTDPDRRETETPALTERRPASPLTRHTDAVEFDAVVPVAGVVTIAGAQQLWVGKNHAGRTVVVWADLASVHVLLDDIVIKTVSSRLTTTDLERLTRRGTRPGRPTPAAAAVDTSTAVTRPRGIEIDRTANRDGIVVVRGHDLHLGVTTSGLRVTLRIEADLIHVTDGRHLLKTLPNPLDIGEIRRLTGVRRTTTALPPPPPAGPQSVQRRVPENGQIMVAGQRIRVSRTHAGTIVTVLVDDHYLRVLDGTRELSLHARTTTKALRNFNAHRPRDR
ncbi:IS481 family transposase [Rhodococcus aetherivorans]|uniref:IS481 family transposase n=1 Tax=Rhodococcus aetherivorans TaxID=191292 RepID=UPI0029490A4D|nr:IS481 family transposase [Rhodococcus aetherivorans]MDV6296727.1 IS481 family transposase [Rhodococcus aetherivorans]